MKRFILDAFLILIVVSIGSTLNQQQPESTIQQRIDEFNRQIEQEEVIEPARPPGLDVSDSGERCPVSWGRIFPRWSSASSMVPCA